MLDKLFNREQRRNLLAPEGSVSVVVPLYNHAAYIAATLDSVVSQTLLPQEIIVVDDGSRDSSAAIVRRYSESNERIMLWQQPNQGAHQTLNAGVHLSRSEYVAILNSDDTYHPERLQQCITYLATHPEAAAVATGLEFMDDNGNELRNPWYEEARAFYRQVGDMALALANGNFIMTTSNLVIRRSVFSEVGYFCSLRYAHDLDFFLRLLLAGKHIHMLERPLLRYRFHANNTIKENAVKVRAEWAAVVSFFAYCLIAQGIEGSEGWRYYRKLLEIVERHQLGRLVLIFQAYLSNLPPGRASSDAFLSDPVFLRTVLDAA